MADNRSDAKFHINITNSSIENLIIGDGSIVNSYCRRLQYVERSSALRSGRKTAIQDGGECKRGTKRQRQTKIRFPQRKFRPDPKRSSDSEEDTPRFTSQVTFPVVSGETERKIAESLKKFAIILNKLHPLRDSGNWKQFDSAAESLPLENEGDLELKILISMEKSVVISYQNNLERAETMVLQALERLEKSKVTDSISYHFLVAMAHCHLTGFYRRQNMHGKAEESIAIAEQNSQDPNSFLKALIYYEMASNLAKYISSIPDGSAREELVTRAKHFMKQCISLCIELDKGRVYIRKHHFGLLKLALMDLNCRTTAARSQNISSRCIEEAENCLKTVEEKYEADMSEGQMIQFYVAKSDLSYRRNNLQDAEVSGRHALSLAESNGFSLEIKGIKDRLEHISRLVRSSETMNLEMPMSQEEFAASLSSSTSPSRKNSPYSSGCEMEVV